jgi:signal peptide peptidase SppA
MNTRFLPLLADRVLNRPLLIHPGKAETILSVLEGRITLGDMAEDPRPDASRFKGGYTKPDGRRTQFTRILGDTALITVDGSLVNRGVWIGAYSGMTSYEGIAAQVDEIAADKDIRRVVLDINSYGGEATGMASLAAKIMALRETRYVAAVVNDVAASAGYGIASAADEIFVSPTSVVGSIGVVMMHIDRSREMEAKGLKPTLIHAGAKKVDGHPFGPLPDNVRADMQKDVLAFYDQFLATVEAGRGYSDKRRKSRLTADDARATEADTFIGAEAIERGLADKMASLDDVLSNLSRPGRAGVSRNSTTRSKAMLDHEKTPDANAGMHTDTALRAAVQKAEADGKTVGLTEGKAQGQTEGANAERARIAAILNSDEGKARPNAALALALAEDSPKAETAIRLLATLPEEKPEAKGSEGHKAPPLSQRSSGAEIGANSGAPGSAGADDNAIAGAFKRATASINARR